MGNPVVHFEVIGKDRDALTSFYTGLFGWKTQEVPDAPYTLVEAEEGGIGGGIGASPPAPSPHVTFYAHVDDLEAALSKAESLGGKRLTEPMDIPNGGQIAHFADPEGQVIGIVTGTA
jgi:predicted enzyme related to lactoylglutathione lyase